MIDLDDLRDLRICNKCRVVYEPRMHMHNYGSESYPINGEFCERCETVKK